MVDSAHFNSIRETLNVIETFDDMNHINRNSGPGILRIGKLIVIMLINDDFVINASVR